METKLSFLDVEIRRVHLSHVRDIMNTSCLQIFCNTSKLVETKPLPLQKKEKRICAIRKSHLHRTRVLENPAQAVSVVIRQKWKH